jgi:hypothetical protein
VVGTRALRRPTGPQESAEFNRPELNQPELSGRIVGAIAVVHVFRAKP